MSDLTAQLERGVVASGQLTARLGFSSQTLMRRVRADRRVVRIGRARATRYGLRRESSLLGSSEFPLFQITADGEPQPIGRLVLLAADETVWLPGGVVFDGLPAEVADMRPAGFMGRAFPGTYPELHVPRRIQDWSDEHILLALTRRGDDGPGNLIVGDESMERWFSLSTSERTRSDYPALAEAATAGAPAGSSAAGEQPKFGAFVEGHHHIVKFAAGGSSVAARWQDLLRLEALALDVLRAGGVDAARATLVESPPYTFLEVERFDRIGARGRRAVMTLAATGVDLSDTWSRAARRLMEAKLLLSEDARRLRLYEAFARCIANPDRHHFNVVVFPEYLDGGEARSVEPTRYRLAPAFDQLPMLYAPTSDGQLPTRELELATPTADTWDVWNDARALAVTFWQQAGSLEGVSAWMRDVAARNAALVSGS
jgi:hypothetical protein